MSSLKSHFLESDYPGLVLPSAKFGPYPAKTNFSGLRKKTAFINPSSQNKLFLTAACLPSKRDEKLAEMRQTTNIPEVEQTYLQLAQQIDSDTVNKKLQNLEELGAEKYIEESLKKPTNTDNKNEIKGPEKAENISSNIVASTEKKFKKCSKKRHSDVLPFEQHFVNMKKPKKKK